MTHVHLSHSPGCRSQPGVRAPIGSCDRVSARDARVWGRVQERVSLTPAQQEQIIALRCELLQQMEAILQERRATFTNLQVRRCPHARRPTCCTYL